MQKHSTYIIFLICFSLKVYSQDIVVKKDSSRLEVKLLEIRSTEIKYKYFNNQDGPTFIINKNDVAYLVYSNGSKEVFKIIAEQKQTDLAANYNDQYKSENNKKDSLGKAAKIGDYISINLDAGIVVNENYANKPRSNYKRLGSLGSPESEEYSVSNKNHIEYGYSLGFNFLAGKSPYFKHLIGINYLNSTGEFIYNHSSGYYDNQTQTSVGYDKKATYRSTIHFINLSTGVRFIIHKRLCIDNNIALNIPFKTVNKVNGYETNSRSSYSNHSKETHYFNNETTHDSKVNVTFSFAPKLSYEFNTGKQKLGVYFSYNISYKYELPWYMAGITYYPFKKLTQRIEKKNRNLDDQSKNKLKIIYSPKFSIDAAVVFNNGYTNTNESYSNKRPANPKEYKMGYNFGINFYHGKSSYFKHFIMASLIESQAKLLKRTYNYTYDPNYTYETINTIQYDSRVLFFNIGSGIKFIVFKHLYFDNGLALNAPFYSTNEIQYNKTNNQWNNFYTTKINSTSDPTIKNKSNEFFIKKINWIFLAKIGYEFNIKQNRFGAFFGWNCSLGQEGQWHMIGLTCYPFKKLR